MDAADAVEAVMSRERATVINKNKEEILHEMKKRGYRITEQRKILVDVIVNDNCRCCKEIYYEALKQDPSIGIATVYRTVGALQDMGILNQEYSRTYLSGIWDSEKNAVLLLEEKIGRRRKMRKNFMKK